MDMQNKNITVEEMDALSNKILGLFQKLKSEESVTASDIEEMLIAPLFKVMDSKDAMQDEGGMKAKPKDKVEQSTMPKSLFSDYQS